MKSPWQANRNHSKGNSANMWGKWVLRPGGNIVALPFISFGVNPNFVTWLSLVVGLIGAVSIAFGAFVLGIILLFLSQLLDYADGTVARSLDRRSGWGRFLDSQFDKCIDIAKWLSVIYLFLTIEGHGFFPSEIIILVTVMVPIVGLMAHSVKLQKRNYEIRVKEYQNVGSPRSLKHDRERDLLSKPKPVLGENYKTRVQQVVLYALGVWQGLNFPFFALALLSGLLEFYVIAALFFAFYSLFYAWLKAFLTNSFLKTHPL